MAFVIVTDHFMDFDLHYVSAREQEARIRKL